jgi:uncharacterized membrane protein
LELAHCPGRCGKIFASGLQECFCFSIRGYASACPDSITSQLSTSSLLSTSSPLSITSSISSTLADHVDYSTYDCSFWIPLVIALALFVVIILLVIYVRRLHTEIDLLDQTIACRNRRPREHRAPQLPLIIL